MKQLAVMKKNEIPYSRWLHSLGKIDVQVIGSYVRNTKWYYKGQVYISLVGVL